MIQVLMLKDVEDSLKIYKKWGYFSRDLMINKSLKVSATVLSTQVRHRLLTQLLKSRKSITVNDYLRFLENKVSRKQAERDLKKSLKLKAKGFTRGRVYLVL